MSWNGGRLPFLRFMQITLISYITIISSLLHSVYRSTGDKKLLFHTTYHQRNSGSVSLRDQYQVFIESYRLKSCTENENFESTHIAIPSVNSSSNITARRLQVGRLHVHSGMTCMYDLTDCKHAGFVTGL